MKFQYALDESEHWQRLSFINTPVLDHSPLLSTETMLTVRAGLMKLSSEDRWQEGDRQSCRMVRQGEKITTHCMQKTRCKCSRRHCFTSQDTWWTERNSSGQTITGGSMSVWFPWSKAIIYPMGRGTWWCMNTSPSIAAEGLTFMRWAKKISCPRSTFIQRNIIGTVLKILQKSLLSGCRIYFQ